MNRLLPLLALVAVMAAPARASKLSDDFAALRSQYKGQFTLSQDPEAVVFREFYDGMWLAGAQKEIYAVSRIDNGAELLHVSFFWVTRLEGQDTLYGPSVGFNVGQGFHAFANGVEGLAGLANMSLPPFAQKAADYTSVEGFMGYRRTVGADDHHFGYGLGFKATIPISDIVAWAKGTPNQKGL